MSYAHGVALSVAVCSNLLDVLRLHSLFQLGTAVVPYRTAVEARPFVPRPGRERDQGDSLVICHEPETTDFVFEVATPTINNIMTLLCYIVCDCV